MSNLEARLLDFLLESAAHDLQHRRRLEGPDDRSPQDAPKGTGRRREVCDDHLTLGCEVRARHSQDPDAVLVRVALSPSIQSISNPTLAIAGVRSCLFTSFPGLVTEFPVVTRYKAIWCAEIMDFKIVCCRTVLFEVALTEVISVPVEVRTQVP